MSDSMMQPSTSESTPPMCPICRVAACCLCGSTNPRHIKVVQEHVVEIVCYRNVVIALKEEQKVQKGKKSNKSVCQQNCKDNLKDTKCTVCLVEVASRHHSLYMEAYFSKIPKLPPTERSQAAKKRRDDDLFIMPYYLPRGQENQPQVPAQKKGRKRAEPQPDFDRPGTSGLQAIAASSRSPLLPKRLRAPQPGSASASQLQASSSSALFGEVSQPQADFDRPDPSGLQGAAAAKGPRGPQPGPSTSSAEASSQPVSAPASYLQASSSSSSNGPRAGPIYVSIVKGQIRPTPLSLPRAEPIGRRETSAKIQASGNAVPQLLEEPGSSFKAVPAPSDPSPTPQSPQGHGVEDEPIVPEEPAALQPEDEVPAPQDDELVLEPHLKPEEPPPVSTAAIPLDENGEDLSSAAPQGEVEPQPGLSGLHSLPTNATRRRVAAAREAAGTARGSRANGRVPLPASATVNGLRRSIRKRIKNKKYDDDTDPSPRSSPPPSSLPADNGSPEECFICRVYPHLGKQIVPEGHELQWLCMPCILFLRLCLQFKGKWDLCPRQQRCDWQREKCHFCRLKEIVQFYPYALHCDFESPFHRMNRIVREGAIPIGAPRDLSAPLTGPCDICQEERPVRWLAESSGTILCAPCEERYEGLLSQPIPNRCSNRLLKGDFCSTECNYCDVQKFFTMGAMPNLSAIGNRSAASYMFQKGRGFQYKRFPGEPDWYARRPPNAEDRDQIEWSDDEEESQPAPMEVEHQQDEPEQDDEVENEPEVQEASAQPGRQISGKQRANTVAPLSRPTTGSSKSSRAKSAAPLHGTSTTAEETSPGVTTRSRARSLALTSPSTDDHIIAHSTEAAVPVPGPSTSADETPRGRKPRGRSVKRPGKGTRTLAAPVTKAEEVPGPPVSPVEEEITPQGSITRAAPRVIAPVAGPSTSAEGRMTSSKSREARKSTGDAPVSGPSTSAERTSAKRKKPSEGPRCQPEPVAVAVEPPTIQEVVAQTVGEDGPPPKIRPVNKSERESEGTPTTSDDRSKKTGPSETSSTKEESPPKQEEVPDEQRPDSPNNLAPVPVSNSIHVLPSEGHEEPEPRMSRLSVAETPKTEQSEEAEPPRNRMVAVVDLRSSCGPLSGEELSHLPVGELPQSESKPGPSHACYQNGVEANGERNRDVADNGPTCSNQAREEGTEEMRQQPRPARGKGSNPPQSAEPVAGLSGVNPSNGRAFLSLDPLGSEVVDGPGEAERAERDEEEPDEFENFVETEDDDMWLEGYNGVEDGEEGQTEPSQPTQATPQEKKALHGPGNESQTVETSPRVVERTPETVPVLESLIVETVQPAGESILVEETERIPGPDASQHSTSQPRELLLAEAHQDFRKVPGSISPDEVQSSGCRFPAVPVAHKPVGWKRKAVGDAARGVQDAQILLALEHQNEPVPVLEVQLVPAGRQPSCEPSPVKNVTHLPAAESPNPVEEPEEVGTSAVRPASGAEQLNPTLTVEDEASAVQEAQNVASIAEPFTEAALPESNSSQVPSEAPEKMNLLAVAQPPNPVEEADISTDRLAISVPTDAEPVPLSVAADSPHPCDRQVEKSQPGTSRVCYQNRAETRGAKNLTENGPSSKQQRAGVLRIVIRQRSKEKQPTLHGNPRPAGRQGRPSQRAEPHPSGVNASNGRADVLVEQEAAVLNQGTEPVPQLTTMQQKKLQDFDAELQRSERSIEKLMQRWALPDINLSIEDQRSHLFDDRRQEGRPQPLQAAQQAPRPVVNKPRTVDTDRQPVVSQRVQQQPRERPPQVQKTHPQPLKVAHQVRRQEVAPRPMDVEEQPRPVGDPVGTEAGDDSVELTSRPEEDMPNNQPSLAPDPMEVEEPLREKRPRAQEAASQPIEVVEQVVPEEATRPLENELKAVDVVRQPFVEAPGPMEVEERPYPVELPAEMDHGEELQLVDEPQQVPEAVESRSLRKEDRQTRVPIRRLPPLIHPACVPGSSGINKCRNCKINPKVPRAEYCRQCLQPKICQRCGKKAHECICRCKKCTKKGCKCFRQEGRSTAAVFLRDQYVFPKNWTPFDPRFRSPAQPPADPPLFSHLPKSKEAHPTRCKRTGQRDFTSFLNLTTTTTIIEDFSNYFNIQLRIAGNPDEMKFDLDSNSKFANNLSPFKQELREVIKKYREYTFRLWKSFHFEMTEQVWKKIMEEALPVVLALMVAAVVDQEGYIGSLCRPARRLILDWKDGTTAEKQNPDLWYRVSQLFEVLNLLSNRPEEIRSKAAIYLFIHLHIFQTAGADQRSIDQLKRLYHQYTNRSMSSMVPEIAMFREPDYIDMIMGLLSDFLPEVVGSQSQKTSDQPGPSKKKK